MKLGIVLRTTGPTPRLDLDFVLGQPVRGVGDRVGLQLVSEDVGVGLGASSAFALGALLLGIEIGRGRRRDATGAGDERGVELVDVAGVLERAREVRTLDLADDCLAALDLVVAPVHSAFSQDRQQMTDRLLRAPGPFRGYVVDWIQLPHWPVFNLADSSITCGAVLMVLLAAQGRRLDGSRHTPGGGRG